LVSDALQFAHNEGIVHRDIKPENILLDKKGRVKITDFGIAKIVQPLTRLEDTLSSSEGERAGVRGGALTGAKDVLGTPHYMAPEQVEKPSTVDHRADIYSLGVVFYELLTGELPLGKFQPPSKKVQVDVRLDEVVLHTLEKEPERRYQQASQVKTDVESIARTPVPRGSGGGCAPSEAAHPPAVADTNRNAKEATIVFAGTFFFLFLLAVVLELSRASVVPFQAFLIASCILGLVICAFSLAGRWPFPSPWFPEPNFSSRNLRRGKVDLERERQPHFSRTAMVGALWAPLLFLAALLFFTTHSAVAVEPGSPPPGPAWWQLLLRFTLLPLGLTAPFGTTLLGSIAISQIRHSRGRLHGLGLAVFDALLFPLLVLDLLILGAAVLGLRGVTAFGAVSGMRSSWVGYWWLWLAVLGVIVLVDWLIIRAVWRAANKPVAGDPTSASSTMASPPPPRSGGHTWKSATVIFLMLAIPVGALLIAGLMKMQSRDRNIQGEVIAEVPITPPRAVRFGPVQEVILNDLDEARGNEALSLARGGLLSLPADFGQRTAAARAGWLDSNRVDLLVDYARGQWAILSRGVQLRDLHIGAWDAPHLGFGGEWPDTAVLETRETREATSYLLPTNAQPPLSFSFRTASGDHGALQITGLFTNDPRGMKLRYKLAQLAGGGGGGSATSAGRDPVPLEFGPVIVRTLSDADPATDPFVIDLDNGRTLTPPPRMRLADSWFAQNGIDAVVATKPGIQGLIGLNLRVHQVPPEQWDYPTPASLAGQIAAVPTAAQSVMSSRGSLPATYLFQTREGGFGVLQITRFTDNPRSVEIRYRLAQPSGGGPGTDFIATYRVELSQQALDAARDFVEEHQWKMQSESGNHERVVFKATDIAGRSVTFENAVLGNGRAQFTISAEPGAELSAERIGAAIWRRLGWAMPEGASAESPAAGGPVTEAKPITRSVSDEDESRLRILALETAADAFGSVTERVLYSVGTQRPITGESSPPR